MFRWRNTEPLLPKSIFPRARRWLVCTRVLVYIVSVFGDLCRCLRASLLLSVTTFPVTSLKSKRCCFYGSCEKFNLCVPWRWLIFGMMLLCKRREQPRHQQLDDLSVTEIWWLMHLNIVPAPLNSAVFHSKFFFHRASFIISDQMGGGRVAFDHWNTGRFTHSSQSF